MPDLIKGKYQIVREIARSNDIVYEAIDTTFGRKIAVKELNIAPTLTGQARRDRIERFNREARAAGKLSHPNIVSVFDFGEENGRYFIAMEFLEGQSLRDALQVRGAFPVSDAIQITCQLLDALTYAHSQGVVHRDIKPDNIHILPGGQAKLTDFGIARLGEEPALTSDGQVFGTPSYMSPEQIEGKGIDFRSDLFSTGVLLYELLAGRKPFTGDSVIAITYAIMNAEPPPINGIPQGVEQVIRRALAKQPARRHASAEQMKYDLKAAESTPAIFLQNQSMQPMPGLNNTGSQNAYGYYGNTPPPPSMVIYPQQNTQYSPGPAPANPPAQPQGGALPWAWNNSGSAPQAPGTVYTNSQLPGVQAPQGSGIPPQYAAAPPYPVVPPKPLITLSPAGRSLLIAFGAAIALGTVIGLSVIAVQSSYEKFQQTVKQDAGGRLMSQGAEAYAKGDYNTAIDRFQAAWKGNPTPGQQNNLKQNLAYSYVQRGNAEKLEGNLAKARADYEAALNVWPDCALAHQELAKIMAAAGETRGAQEHSSAAKQASPGGTVELPGKLDISAPPPTAGTNGNATRELEAQQIQAQQVLQEGDRLRDQGDIDGARDKWRTAAGMAPGTDISSAAQERLQQSEPSP